MKGLLPIAVLLYAFPAAAQRLSYEQGVLRIAGMARGSNRSIWARSKTLAVVLPAQEGVENESLKIGYGPVREARLRVRSGRVEIELRADEPAERLLGRVELTNDGADLLIRLDSAPKLPRAILSAEAAGQAATAPELSTRDQPASVQTAAVENAQPAPTDASGEASVARTKTSAQQGLPWLKREVEQQNPPTTRPVWALVGLMVVAGAGALWWRRRQRPLDRVQPGIAVVTSRALSPRHKLLVVDVAGEQLLLACTDKGISLLRRLKVATAGEAESSRSVPADQLIERLIDQRAELAEDHVELNATSNRDHSRKNERQSSASELAAGDLSRSAFIAQLSEQLQARQPQPQQDELLGESWAEGILALRRARRQPGERPSRQRI